MADRQLLMPEARVEAAEPLTSSLQETKSDPATFIRPLRAGARNIPILIVTAPTLSAIPNWRP
jgi:hypothetical protein